MNDASAGNPETDRRPLRRKSVFWYYRRAVRTCYRRYGLGATTIGYTLSEGIGRLAVFRALRIDTRIRKRKLAAAEVTRPLFILGHPRSGTTLLHKVLIGTHETAAFEGWQLYWPALTGRRGAKFLVALLSRIGSTELVPDWTGHRIALDAYDEEEFLYNLTYDGPMKTAMMLGLDDDEYPELERPNLLPEADQWSALERMDGYFRRQIIATGKSQIAAQMHFSTFRLETMLAYWPDATFIYLVRDPLRTVPSYMSLILNVIRARWGLDDLDPAVVERLKRRLYRGALRLYRHFHELDVAGRIPRDRVMVLRYADLVADIPGAVDRICDFSGLKLGPDLETHLASMSAQQGRYRRPHRVMSLAELGLEREQLLSDFRFVYDRYGIEPGE